MALRTRLATFLKLQIILCVIALSGIAYLSFVRRNGPDSGKRQFDAATEDSRMAFSDFAVSADGSSAVSASAERLDLWLVRDGSRLDEVLLESSILAVEYVAQSNEWAVLQRFGKDGVRLITWRPEIQRLTTRCESHCCNPTRLTFSRDGTTVALACTNSQMMLLRSNTLDEWRVIHMAEMPDAIEGPRFALSDNGQWLVAIDRSNVIGMWNVDLGVREYSAKLPFRASCLAVFGDDRPFAVVAAVSAELALVDLMRQSIDRLTWLQGCEDVCNIAVSWDGFRIALADERGAVYVYDVPERCLLRTIDGNGLRVRGIRFASRGDVLAVSRIKSGSYSGYVGFIRFE